MKDAMQNYLKALGIDQKMHEASVLAQWEKILGSAIAARTEKKYIKDRILYVDLNSSVIRDEMQLTKSEIIKKINEAAGVDIIDDIFLR